MISFSAKDLCVRTCMQLKMFAEHPDMRPKPNFNTEFGETFQHQIATTVKGLIGEEMRGSYIQDNICINFSNDIVCNDSVIEVKSILDNKTVEDWYFNSAITQCAVYKALLEKCGGKLITATFFAELGHPVIETIVKPDTNYLLRFGEDTYKIETTNNEKIIDFIIEKAKATLTWTDAKIFDYQYKHLEYDTLKKYFTYEKIENFCQSGSN